MSVIGNPVPPSALAIVEAAYAAGAAVVRAANVEAAETARSKKEDEARKKIDDWTHNNDDDNAGAITVPDSNAHDVDARTVESDRFMDAIRQGESWGDTESVDEYFAQIESATSSDSAKVETPTFFDIPEDVLDQVSLNQTGRALASYVRAWIHMLNSVLAHSDMDETKARALLALVFQGTDENPKGTQENTGLMSAGTMIAGFLSRDPLTIKYITHDGDVNRDTLASTHVAFMTRMKEFKEMVGIAGPGKDMAARRAMQAWQAKKSNSSREESETERAQNLASLGDRFSSKQRA